MDFEHKAVTRLVEVMGGGIHIESTGAKVVDYTGDLYNVDGSDKDPKIDKLKWKPLLIEKGISKNSNCYVTNATPPGYTHPQFNVGGHMTPNSDGKVDKGGTCYLMPLCSYHNNKARDGVKFTHDKDEMVELSGYMEGDSLATFSARLENDDPYSVLFLTDDGWQTENISAEKMSEDRKFSVAGAPDDETPVHHVVLRREKVDGRAMLKLERANLPT